MTPIDAYNLLVNATAALSADRATHHKIEDALLIIKNLIPKPKTDPEKQEGEPASKETIDNGKKNP